MARERVNRQALADMEAKRRETQAAAVRALAAQLRAEDEARRAAAQQAREKR